MKKLGRNDPCHCGSGLKYKKCCLSKDDAVNVTRLAAPQPPSLADIIDRELKWPNELHRLIAHHFLQNTAGLYEAEHIAELILTWNKFAHEELPVSKKLGAYPSALEYVLCQMFEYDTTQSELAEKYKVSVATLSQRANQLFDFLEDHAELPGEPSALQHSASGSPNSRMKMEQEMARLHALLDQQNFDSIEEINTFLEQNMNSKPSRSKKVSKQEQASELLYQAWEEPNLQRRMKLAQDALLLDPSSGDAYNILAECSSSSKEMAYFYKQGMMVEEKRLGEAFFKENKGHFWGYLPTRPYMRAKKGYAEACAMLDKMPEAIKHYRELLELNPNDNQGVRDLLLPAYIETLEWKAAEQLIRQFDEDGSASFNYSRVLVEYGLRGKSSKLTSLIKKATAHNPFVPAYLQGKKQLPRKMPDYMGFGDDREAIVYALMNRHLWLTRPELLQLLPERRK
ncbi:SEC-C metal-binding domain-containing protein [Paenibacillus sp. LHD-117]|uniref:SEC-C metal-binding domain-containing protein n=1 Tax=Paenibacillus sp. LHD-117 TaxID=3071412 RepID=UPI0027E1A1B8|nr:SEC-C metal-binding domain-containing protein [Paenibacillus sp. LHD-117]MDQ6423065.1 SEC-C metal-binding domain-containing protein [Paenibacillus sp. LHD-117]